MMSMQQRPLVWLFSAAIIVLVLISVSSSTSCSSNSDCGGNDISHEVCSSGVCSLCTSDHECGEGSACNSEGYCTLDSLFSSFSVSDILATCAILIGSIVAAGGGLGGGGIFVPVFILIIGLETKTSAALSQATIFGGSIVNLIMNFREHHPIRKHRPLPDLATILIFEPMLLGGTIIGVILNVIFPDPIILACLIIVLSYATVRTTRKGIRMWREESELRKEENVREVDSKKMEFCADELKTLTSHEAGAAGTIGEDESKSSESIDMKTQDKTSEDSFDENDDEDENEAQGLMSYGTIEKPLKKKKNSSRMNDKWVDMARACGLEPAQAIRKSLKELEPYIAEEKRVVKPMLIVFLIWIIVSLFSIFRGVESIFGVESCSSAYWALTFGVFPFLFIITFLMCYKEVSAFKKKSSLGWESAKGDIEWNASRATSYPMIAGFAGLMGGLLGIGGGMIVSPLLLELGVLPRVAAATSALAVLVTSSSATLQFILLGMLKIDYMIFFMCIGVVGTFIGQTVVNYAVKQYGRASVVVFAVASVIGLAVILMGLDGVLNIVNGETSLSFSEAC